MEYNALIIDVIDSRKYENRFLVQEILKFSIDFLNERFKPLIKKEVVFSAGDEMQGLFLNGEAAYLYYRKLKQLVYPIKIRAGLGRGTIKFDMDNWASTEIDGQAYYNARIAIKCILNKKDNIYYNSNLSTDKYINTLMDSNLIIKSSQSDMVNLIELIYDELYLISSNEINNKIDEGFIGRLYSLKSQLDNNMFKNINLNINLFVNQAINSEMCDYLDIKKSIKSINIDRFFKRGFSTIISEILNLSRQNIDKHINNGKIKESRNIDGAIVLMISDIEERKI